MSKVKQEKRYFPSSEDIEAFRFCVSHNLIKLSPVRIVDSNAYYLVRSNYPKEDLYFPLDNKKPPTPSNRIKFTEYQVYEKMFKIYKDFYMRNRPKEHQALVDSALSKEAEEKKLKKELEKEKINNQKANISQSKTKKEFVNKNKELDLFDLIKLAEGEDLN